MDSRRFRLQIRQELDDALDDVEDRLVAIGLEAFARITLKTPVDTGRARGNWQLTIGTITTQQLEREDKSGGQAIADAETTVLTYDREAGWPTIYIQNNLPYIERLEDGSSTQAPNGMVATTVAEIQSALL